MPGVTGLIGTENLYKIFDGLFEKYKDNKYFKNFGNYLVKLSLFFSIITSINQLGDGFMGLLINDNKDIKIESTRTSQIRTKLIHRREKSNKNDDTEIEV